MYQLGGLDKGREEVLGVIPDALVSSIGESLLKISDDSSMEESMLPFADRWEKAGVTLSKGLEQLYGNKEIMEAVRSYALDHVQKGIDDAWSKCEGRENSEDGLMDEKKRISAQTRNGVIDVLGDDNTMDALGEQHLEEQDIAAMLELAREELFVNLDNMLDKYQNVEGIQGLVEEISADLIDMFPRTITKATLEHIFLNGPIILGQINDFAKKSFTEIIVSQFRGFLQDRNKRRDYLRKRMESLVTFFSKSNIVDFKDKEARGEYDQLIYEGLMMGVLQQGDIDHVLYDQNNGLLDPLESNLGLRSNHKSVDRLKAEARAGFKEDVRVPFKKFEWKDFREALTWKKIAKKDFSDPEGTLKHLRPYRSNQKYF